MITTKRTALSEKEYETKLNTRIEANFDAQQAEGFAMNTAPVIEPELTAQRITPVQSKEQVMPTIKESRKITAVNAEVPEIKGEEKVENAAAIHLDARTKMIMAMYIGVSFILSLIVKQQVDHLTAWLTWRLCGDAEVFLDEITAADGFAECGSGIRLFGIDHGTADTRIQTVYHADIRLGIAAAAFPLG